MSGICRSQDVLSSSKTTFQVSIGKCISGKVLVKRCQEAIYWQSVLTSDDSSPSLRMALQNILKLTKELSTPKGAVINLLIQNNIIETLRALMTAKYHDNIIQQTSLHILDAILGENLVYHDQIDYCSLYRLVIKSMQEHLTDESIQIIGMKLMGVLVKSTTSDGQLLLRETHQSEISELALVLLAGFRESAPVQTTVLQTLNHLLESNPIMLEFFMSKIHIFNELTSQSPLNKDVWEAVLHIYCIISGSSDKLSNILIHNLVYKQICLVVNKYFHNEQILEMILRILVNLNHKTVISFLVESNFIDIDLFKIMSIYSKNINLISNGLKLLKMAVIWCCRVNQMKKWIIPLYHSLFIYMTSPLVQISGYEVITAIMENCPDFISTIGEDTANDQYPIHSLCLGTILQYTENTEVCSTACNAIYWLAAGNTRISELLMQKNTYLQITETMYKHRNNAVMVLSSCRALRALCLFSSSQKKLAVTQCKCLMDLFEIMLTSFVDNPPIVMEAMCTLTCLLNCDANIFSTTVQNIFYNIISALKRFPEYVLIQESGLETLAVASQLEWIHMQLQQEGIMELIMNIMVKFPENLCIQKKALYLLQLILSKNISSAAWKRMAHIIVNLMYEYPFVPSIQAECCILILLYERLGIYPDEILFIRQGCQTPVFCIALQFSHCYELVDIACRCLNSLTHEKNKSVMLVRACAESRFIEVECLLHLEADVNFVYKGHTALLYACQNADELIVRLILEKEVLDILTPLKVACRKQYHKIVAILLLHIGQDKEAGIVSWNGLGLGNLNVDWFTPTFVGDLCMKHPSAGIGKKLAKKIKRISKENNISSPVCTLRHSESSVSSANIDDELDLPGIELKEWKRTTLTGAVIPFSIYDPRFNFSNYCRGQSHNTKSLAGSWIRKKCILTDTSDPKTGSLSPEDCVIYQNCEHKSTAKNKIFSTVLHKKSLTFSPSKCREFFSDDESSSVHVRGKLRLRRKSSSYLTPYKNDSCESRWPGGVNTLNISNNNIHSFVSLSVMSPAQQRSFSSLQRVILSNNNLVVIPEHFFNCLPELKELDISSNNLQRFPDAALACTLLETLKIKDNKLNNTRAASFPISFSLKKLNMSGNSFTVFPGWLTEHLPGLEKLHLKNIKMTTIENKPLRLKRLSKLNLSHNQIHSIPDKFFIGCNNLVTLKIDNNGLEQLPQEDVLEELPKLQQLYLSDNRLATKEPWYLPKFILKLSSLSFLDLRRNNLTCISPPAMWSTKDLKKLLLSNNQISNLDLSEGAKNWSSLEVLNISHNRLLKLPPQIGFLKSLQSLDFSHNKGITCLPDELGACDKLWEMPLDGLEISLNTRLLNGRVSDLILYLSHRLKKSQRQYCMKMMVVGYGGHGKTTLLRSLMKEKRQVKTTATVGIIVKRWKYKHICHKKNVEYCITTWDFAGQEEFYSTHQCFLSRQAIYVVVYDLRCKNIVGLKCWLANIQAQAPGCPVIVVGSHYDLIPKDDKYVQKIRNTICQLQEMPEFPQIHDIIMVDTRTENEGIDYLRNVIKKVIDSYKVHGEHVMGQKVPANYVKLAELVSNAAVALKNEYPVLNYQGMMALLKKAQLAMSQVEFNQAIRFLDDTGVLRHFDEAGNHLKDLYFIDPAWLCRMLAQIVTVKQINPFVNKYGVIRKQDLKMLFTGKSIDTERNYVFPPSQIPQYLKLLEKFEIALPQNEDELLLPCRLPTTPPDMKIPKSDSITRLYCMSVTPIGMWLRLMTRLIAFSKKKTLLSMTDPKRLQYYCYGLFVYWSDDMYFFLEKYRTKSDEIRVKVPNTSWGSRLMGEVTDHIDALVEEWYPGLLTVDAYGKRPLQVLAPCPSCSGGKIHLFDLENLIEQSTVTNVIRCPVHDGKVLLASMAPDVMLGDLEEELYLQQDKFTLQTIQKYVLGNGEFGIVYQGTYQNKPVAVKLFLNKVICHPHKMLRKETTVLRRLKHPSVVSLLAVGLRPRMMIMELAPYGSLKHVVSSRRVLSPVLIHRIALQIAEGLMYLHQRMIIYRDLKPTNILVFSLSTTSLINVKISDYGISQVSALYGLTANEGTPGYQAPEVARKENYSFQADVFSYGILLYFLLSGGEHPFGYLQYPTEMEQAIIDDQQISLSCCKKSGTWPDMLDLLSQCLVHMPHERPSSDELCRCLKNPEILCLKQIIPVSKTFPTDCMTIKEDNNGDWQLWMTCGTDAQLQLSWINLSDNTFILQGLMLDIMYPLCLYGVEHVIFFGCINGSISVFDTEKKQLLHNSVWLLDSVLSIYCYHRSESSDIILAGTADGSVAIFTLDTLIEKADCEPVFVQTLKHNEPVMCIDQHDDTIYTSCGNSVYKLSFPFELDLQTAESESYHYFTAYEMMMSFEGCCLFHSDDQIPIINRMLFLGKMMYVTRRNSSTVEIWDTTKEHLRNHVNINKFLECETKMARITAACLHASTKVFWIGTGGGHLVLLKCTTLQPLMVIRRYIRPIRSLLSLPETETNISPVIICGSYGFLPQPGLHEKDLFGCISIWDANFPQQIQSYKEDSRKRQELVEQMAKEQTYLET